MASAQGWEGLACEAYPYCTVVVFKALRARRVLGACRAPAVALSVVLRRRG